MPKNASQSEPQVAPLQEDVFPSDALAELIFRARGNMKRFVLQADLAVVKTELCIAVANAIRNMTPYAGQPTPLSQGNMPTLLFVTQLLPLLRIEKCHGEDRLLSQLTKELKDSIGLRTNPLSVNRCHELTYDAAGDKLVLRLKQAQSHPEPHLRIVPAIPALATA